MKPSTNKRIRLLQVTAVTAVLLVAALVYALIVRLTGHGLPCLFHMLTGLDCPGCGMSRAMGALAHLDVRAAFRYNLLWPLYGAYAVWVYLSAALPYVRCGSLQGKSRAAWVDWVVLAIVLLYGVFRNLPWVSL